MPFFCTQIQIRQILSFYSIYQDEISDIIQWNMTCLDKMMPKLSESENDLPLFDSTAQQ
jgi:hypothetical protein